MKEVARRSHSVIARARDMPVRKGACVAIVVNTLLESIKSQTSGWNVELWATNCSDIAKE